MTEEIIINGQLLGFDELQVEYIELEAKYNELKQENEELKKEVKQIRTYEELKLNNYRSALEEIKSIADNFDYWNNNLSDTSNVINSIKDKINEVL